MKLIGTAKLMERLDVASKETIRQMVKKKILPQPIRGGNGAPNKWIESEVDQAIESLGAARNSASTPALQKAA